MEIYQGIN